MKKLLLLLMVTGCAMQKADAMQKKGYKTAYAFLKQGQKRKFGKQEWNNFVDKWNNKAIMICAGGAAIGALTINSFLSYDAGKSDGATRKIWGDVNSAHYLAGVMSMGIEMGLLSKGFPMFIYSIIQAGFYAKGYHDGKKIRP